MTPHVCRGNDITIKDKALGGYLCQECLSCPAGEGLSVNCGDVINPQTPVECHPCVTGETYSGANEVGACKVCDTCDEYQETIQGCTLTSNAVCGKCKHGAYFDNTVGRCKPCSSCCNDGKDILESGCQVPGVPANMRCTFARSEKCGKVAAEKVMANASISASPTQRPTPSTTVTPWPTTMYPATKKLDEPLPLSASAATSSYAIAVTVGVAGGFVVILAFLALLYYCKKRKNREKKNGLSADENLHLEPDECDVTETDEQELVIVAPPEEESPEQPPLSPVEETCKNPFPIQDSQPPGCTDTTDLKPSQSYLDPPVISSLEDYKETEAAPTKTGDEPCGV